MKLMAGDSTLGEKPRLKYGWIRMYAMNRALTLLMIACLSLSTVSFSAVSYTHLTLPTKA